MRRRTGAGLVSYSPEQETRTWWEKALIPFVYTRLSHKYSYAEVNHPDSPAAAASGQYLLIRREDYARIGGHAAVAGEVLEDVALARLAKQAGVRLHFASGNGIMRVRMYRTFAAMWQGWTKNLYPLMGRHVPRRGAGAFQSGAVDSFVGTSAGAGASNLGCAGCCVAGGAACRVCRGPAAKSFSGSACLILLAGSCALRRGAAELGMALCAGQRGLEGAGVSGES